jgi:hypothetical protein
VRNLARLVPALTYEMVVRVTHIGSFGEEALLLGVGARQLSLLLKGDLFLTSRFDPLGFFYKSFTIRSGFFKDSDENLRKFQILEL